jgi:Na+(H+)/acetate symporter ActP
MSATISASATLAGTRYAKGFMSADIRPATQLEAAEFSAYVLDTENVETGLSVRNTLRLMAAAMAGELSGAAGTTITIRNAFADDKDRIVATVTSEGNRTAITYDLTDS